ncbi:MAG TPA: F0F1 ATP synthase subunit gamma [Candidatus Saccharimonadales bacterium]|nr:F0F1 ATP synthase subunit gamma [Candidatus Saccharimonadales bacterium]
MRQLNDIAQERETMSTVVELTGAFEGIASMHISQIKDQVLTSQNFFDELWKIYSQIRVDQTFHFGRGRSSHSINKELIILVTAEGSFSGDVDHRVVEAVLKVYNSDRNDIIVVGHHGATQLSQRGVPVARSFKLPRTDTNINVLPLAGEVQKYASTVVYYPTYLSLMRQDVKSVQMSAEVTERGRSVEKSDEIITEGDYIFEPSTVAVVSHLENSMLQIMLSQIILESKLAQYASRFRAMHSARDKADSSFNDLNMAYSRARRYNKDERIKEIINGLRAVES